MKIRTKFIQIWESIPNEWWDAAAVAVGIIAIFSVHTMVFNDLNI